MSDKNLGWALKNGDLDRVKEIIEADVSSYHDTMLVKDNFCLYSFLRGGTCCYGTLKVCIFDIF